MNEHERIAAPGQLVEQFDSVNALFRHRSPCRVSCLLSSTVGAGSFVSPYIEHFLTPALRPGKVVSMDNLGAHKGERVRELIESRGCELLYLTPYPPDLNPLGEAFSKVKGLLRRAGPRTRGALIEAMGQALGVVGSRDARGFFEHCGYHLPA